MFTNVKLKLFTFVNQNKAMDYLQLATQYLETKLKGKYIYLDTILPILQSLNSDFEISEIGKSVQERVIHQVKIGTGKTKILMWSQMHGNESTTTKAVIDLLNLLNSENEWAKTILSKYTLKIIPMLNPDGAFLYTRANAVQVDLNRDSQDLTQPESRVLKQVYTQFKPDFGFNLHDQRTIFGVGNTNKPATVSFLSPSYNENRDVNEVRKKAMSVIVTMNNELQKHISGQVGRFDDGFNLNCIGDTLQYCGIPTILFESGHYPNDYSREETRKYIFISLITALKNITDINYSVNPIHKYQEIPQNNTDFYDIIVRNVGGVGGKIKKNITFGLQYQEVLRDSAIDWVAHVFDVEENLNKFGHLEFDAQGKEVDIEPIVGEIANFSVGNICFKEGKLVN
mgnify:CR=1 FL=1